MLNFSIIIPVKNEGFDILKCLDSIRDAKYNENYSEIVIVDDSDEHNKRILKDHLNKKKFSNLKYFENLGLGLSGSCNYAAKNSDGKYLVFINSDNILPQNFFLNLNLEIKDSKFDTLSIQNFVKNTDNMYGLYLDAINRRKYMNNSYFNKLNLKKNISYTEGFTVTRDVFLSSGGFLHQKKNSIIAGEDLVLGFNLIESGAIGKISSKVQISHLVPECFKDFYHHRYIRGYGVPQVGFFYFRYSKTLLLTRTLTRLILKFLKFLILISSILEANEINKYSKQKNFYKFFFLNNLDNIILMYGEIRSLLKILFAVDIKKVDLESEYIKSKSYKMIYVTAAQEEKYSVIKNACLNKFQNSIKILAAEKNFVNYSKISIFNLERLIYKILFKFGYIYDYQNFSSRLINLIKFNNIDYILINKCNFIDYKTLEIVKKINPSIKIIFWGEDNMFIKQNSSKNFFKSLNYFDAYYSLDRGDIENKKITEKVNNHLLSNPTINKVSILKKISNSSLDLSEINFIGYYDKKRIEYLSYLGNSGVRIKIYGNGWNLCKNKDYKNLSFHDPIYGFDYQQLINNSLISINFLRDFTKDIINLKSIEIPAYGGLLLSEYSEYQDKLLKNNKEAFYFSSKEELLEKIIYIQNNKEKLDLIRNNALKVIKDGKFATEDVLEDVYLKL